MKIYLALILNLVLTLNCYATTVSELIVHARQLSGDSAYTEQPMFIDAQILAMFNEAQQDALSTTLCIRREYSFDTSSGTVYYNLPSNFMQIDRVLLGNRKIEEKTPAKLDQASTEWETVTGEPINYFINFSSRTKIGMYPYPVTNTTTDTVKVEYYALAATITSSVNPFDGITEFKPFYVMLSYYTGAQMLYLKGMIADGDRNMQRYFAYRSLLNDYCRARPGYLPNVSVAPSH